MISMFIFKNRSLTYIRKWIFLAIIMCIHSLQAQETQVITVQDAIQTALHKNINLQLYANQVATNRVNANQEKANFYPEITGSALASKNVIESDYAGTFMPSNRNSSSIDFQISAGIGGLNILHSLAAHKSAKLEVSSSETNLNQMQQLITFNVIADYLSILQSQEFIQVEEENLKAQQEQLKQIETFYQVGKRTEADLLLQQADIKQSELDFIKAERDFEINKIQIKQTMGELGNSVYKYAALNMDKIISAIEKNKVINGSENTEAWYSNRHDFQAQKFKIDASNKNASAARSLALPSIGLNFDVGSNYYNSISNEAFTDQVFDRNLYAKAGLSISVPIFDRFRTKHNVEKAKIRLSNEQLNLENKKLTIQSEIQQARLDFKTAKIQRESAQAQYIYTQKALQITKERYAAGAATFVELSEARVKNLKAVYQKISADYEFILQYAAVHYAIGNLDKALEIIQ